MCSIRRHWISDPAFRFFKKVLPPLSETEKEAMESGSVWWDGELFSGHPDWQKLLNYPKPRLTHEEQQFIDHQLETLLAMLDDYQMVKRDRDLPPAVWDYLRKEGFFAFIISRQYGGHGFSALANSTIVTKIASRSVSVASTVMVPNSLGPAELLSRYGTEAQKRFWLPRLADGRDIPCFALTSPDAGSDAGSIPDEGIVCRDVFDGEETIGIKLHWNKRYITLAPVATVLGLAFKLYDPDGLIGDKKHIGITLALIPANHPGVETGERHDPMGLAFMNGPTRGHDVFIPLDWIIGGQAFAGKGWRMLMECLSAGRGISLPAMGTAIGHLTARTCGAYAYVRKQFGSPIGTFEGVAQKLGRIGGLTYLLEATRILTTTALDLQERPGIVTAIAKSHMTEMARILMNDAMDIHGGRGLQQGPMNYLAQHYSGTPIAITVEGSNILTRNLMIFGQGAIRCHPYLLHEMAAAMISDPEEGAGEFDRQLPGHIVHTVKNAIGTLVAGITGARFIRSGISGETCGYYRDLTRISRALALSAEIAMIVLGGNLKRKEMISARLGDVLSYLYMASAVLKRYENDGRQQSDLPYVHYGVQHCLHYAAIALQETCTNFPQPWVGKLLSLWMFPLGNGFRKPTDALTIQLAETLMMPGAHRERLTCLCYVGESETDAVGLVERAFQSLYAIRPLERKLRQAEKAGRIPSGGMDEPRLRQAQASGILTATEVEAILNAEKLRTMAIQVDHFSKDFSEVLTFGNSGSIRTPTT
ncbi:acyl-CoA dehydrogenase [Vibrio sp. HA2012]|uniref:acyl-CoA dehydrogenase n=1 Tax=Vibrio sp. HA2012 TaxID=1971595 RepID=UPI000C2C225E|nr:acyl-CoA dehydrogenase [Vibrio sp. HA2012]PJC88291.1 acyl-CoA dehydrogenase [Vibrio sp. HA2012]